MGLSGYWAVRMSSMAIGLQGGRYSTRVQPNSQERKLAKPVDSVVHGG
ncbi:unannotated protein [freshwater metagenome]|uniref:Unannotated protein n=1 Tax=freshwater metagenome TaxID=449393 RepID=A0A6J7UQV2_9ZZZZ